MVICWRSYNFHFYILFQDYKYKYNFPGSWLTANNYTAASLKGLKGQPVIIMKAGQAGRAHVEGDDQNPTIYVFQASQLPDNLNILLPSSSMTVSYFADQIV